MQGNVDVTRDEVPVADIVAVQQLLAHFGHLLDDREWSRLDEVVTADFHFDARGIGGPEFHALEDWRRYVGSVWNPLAHHVTNIHVSHGEADDELRVHSKFLTVIEDGTCHTGDYLELARRTSNGWRIRERVYVGRLVFKGDASTRYLGGVS